MSEQSQIVVGVDIGNSGLRIARLFIDDLGQFSPSLAHRSSCSHRWLGPVGRIDWKARAAHEISSSLAAPQYYSDDNAWLDELDRTLSRCIRLTSDCTGESIQPLDCQRLPIHWLVSSVRRDATEVLRAHLAQCALYRSLFVTRSDINMSIDVEFPDRVGVDRLLAAYAAITLFESRPMIVIQAGSAVTVDWVSPQAEFAGGAIVPGVPIMLRLLGQAADGLPHLVGRELIELPNLPGKNTEQAMTCGVSSAMVGGTQHLVARYRSQSSPNVPVILSGGDGPRLAKHVPEPLEVVDHLVLVGLALVAKRALAR